MADVPVQRLVWLCAEEQWCIDYSMYNLRSCRLLHEADKGDHNEHNC